MTGNEYQKLAERTMDFKNLTPAELEMHALHGMVEKQENYILFIRRFIKGITLMMDMQ